MTTFEILDEIKALEEMLIEVNEETGEVIDNTEVLKDYIEKLKLTREEKLDNIEMLKRERKSQIEVIKQEINRLKDRIKMFENEVEKLAYLQDLLLGGEKYKTTKFTFSYRTTKSIKPINEQKLIDMGYKRVKVELDKEKIKQHKDELLEEGLIKEIENKIIITR